jgi:peptide/nickel transport system permease protein
MGRFVLKRVGQGLVVVFLVVVIVFLATRTIGDPVDFLLPTEATQEQRDALTRQLGYDRPLAVQFVSYLNDVVHFEFGDSLHQRRPTAEIVRETLPATLQLVAISMTLAVLIAVPMGVLAALKPASGLDRLTTTTSLLGLSIPQFWLGILLILVFAVQLQWLPSANAGGLDHLVLPALTLALPTAGRLTMMVRSSMIDELNRQYVKTAKAKGMPLFKVVGSHALSNAAIPLITLVGWELIRALAGYTIVVERVFEWPGLGKAAFSAIQNRDIPVLQTVVLVVAVMVVAVNITIDLLYRVADPRIKVA